MTLPARIAAARLALRPLAPGDAGPAVAALSDFALARRLSPAPHPVTAADFDAMPAQSPPGAVRAPADAAGFAGVVGLAPRPGCWIAPDRPGSGHATEAAGAVIAAHGAARPGAPVERWHMDGNAASARVLERRGFAGCGRDAVFSRALNRRVPVPRLALAQA